ncbi:thiolase [Aquamicrobium sp. LC103]|uniref:thiolase C-terminal domain-containing protein n=1 Tax=Aquamicrobium sp. LC103 TaxID=1120658 RepID=UPI00063E9E2D|nr:thiolase [Aquamicrobium sp. LC103]TKT74501.1 thiolase [Aquamicrobium sp. LC103]
MSIARKTALVGVGSTPYYKRGKSLPQTMNELVCKAILAAVDDAGLLVGDIDGFAYYSGGFDTPYLMETLGIPELRFSATVTATGGGSAGAVQMAAMAVASGVAKTVVVVGGNQQAALRFGAFTSGYAPSAEGAFFAASGLVGPGHMFALLARRHMHVYGTKREHFAEIAMAMRAHAIGNPNAVMQKPLTLDDYFAAPLIADPLCLYDFCLETDGAIAVVVTSAARARDLKQVPVVIHAAMQGGERGWGRSLYWMNMPEEHFLTSGHRFVARELYRMAGLTPADIDTAQLYDHFTPMVIAQLEDYGFCRPGEGGEYVASGAIRYEGGSLPVNTDGGQLSCGYIWGMTHIREAMEQIRGTAFRQVQNVNFALATGGPSNLPLSAVILGK